MGSFIGFRGRALLLGLAIGLGSLGCGGTEGDGGGGGTGGTGGSEALKIALPECALNGHDDLRTVWNITKHILHYMHHVEPLDPAVVQQRAVLPDLADLPPIEELTDPPDEDPSDDVPLPRVLWSTFRWTPEQDDGEPQVEPERTFVWHVYQGLDEGIYGVEDDPNTLINEYLPRSFSVDDGLYQGRVAILDWHIDDRAVGAGTFSVAGLGPVSIPPRPTYYAARVGIIAFPECIVPDKPKDAAVLCSDPEVPDPSNDNPWFEEGTCRFELTSFGVNINLTSPLAEPTSAVIGFEAKVGDATLENGSIIVGTEGNTDFSASYAGQPVSFTINFDTEELTLRFPGEPEQSCLYDTASGDITDCGPTT
ncbi:MAG: hypothetical protein WBN70_11760 [Polyangiales bacterium]